MNPSKVLEALHGILEKAGLLDILSIGTDKNEAADIMWFSSNAKSDFLAVYEKPLFPFSCIENITYKYKREDDNLSIDFNYADDLCIVTFYLKGNCLFLIECDKDCCLNLYFNSSPGDNTKWIDDNTDDFKRAISKYILAIEKQDFFEGLIEALFYNLENQRLDNELCDNQHRIIFDYLLGNKNDNEMLFLYAFEAANFISADYNDYPYFADIISEIINRDLVDELFVYVRKRWLDYYYFKDDIYLSNSILQDIVKRIAAQIKGNNSDCK